LQLVCILSRTLWLCAVHFFHFCYPHNVDYAAARRRSFCDIILRQPYRVSTDRQYRSVA